MDVGLHLPIAGDAAGRASLLGCAQTAEDAGLASVWVGDHIAFPVGASARYPYSRDGAPPFAPDQPFLEAVVALAAVAGATKRIRLGTSVLVLPQRDEILVARQLATLAFLAPGRAIAGVGAGWLREEFDALRRPFAGRGMRLDEQIQALRGMWGEPGFEMRGAHVAFPPIYVEPRPPSPPPIWIGGNSPAALRRAGRLGDAWHAAGPRDAGALRQAMATVHAAAADAGRDPGNVALTARVGLGPGERGRASLARRLETLREAGCGHVVVDPVATSSAEHEAMASTVADLGRASA